MEWTGVAGWEKSQADEGPEVDASDTLEYASDGLRSSWADCGGVIGHELGRP